MRLSDLPERQRKSIRAWCMYDFANSAFASSGLSAIFPVYFVFLFKEAIGESGEFLGIAFTGSSMWSLAVVLSTTAIAASSPVLGVISDRVPIKKTLLWVYVSTGSLFTALIFFSAYTSQPWAWVFAMFIIANVGFVGSIIIYNSLLPHMGPRGLLDDISSRGYAYGYVGGGIIVVVHLALIVAAQDSAIEDLVTRVAIASIGVWWFGWSLWTLLVVQEPPIKRPVEGLNPASALSMGFRELGRTFREVTRFKVALLYLGAYMMFNDGLHTVLAIAGAFGADTLGVSLSFNLGTIVIVQFIGAPGAMAFARLARRFSTRSALTVTLIGWIVIILIGVGMAPLPHTKHTDYDLQLSYREDTGDYVVDASPYSEADLEGDGEQWEGERFSVEEGAVLSPEHASYLPEVVRNPAFRYEYSVSIQGGGLDGQSAVGPAHPSVLGDGPIDWWPSTMRSVFWKPLGMDVGYQWLMNGFLVGLVIGGSQALSRSLFAQITPQARSGEFFSFFGFITRASSVIGPTLYIIATAIFDTRVAVTSILIIIVIGTIVLQRVNVSEGARVAEAESRRYEEGDAAGG